MEVVQEDGVKINLKEKETKDELKEEDAPLPGDVFIYQTPPTIFQDLLWNEDWQACYVGFVGNHSFF